MCLTWDDPRSMQNTHEIFSVFISALSQVNMRFCRDELLQSSDDLRRTCRVLGSGIVPFDFELIDRGPRDGPHNSFSSLAFVKLSRFHT